MRRSLAIPLSVRQPACAGLTVVACAALGACRDPRPVAPDARPVAPDARSVAAPRIAAPYTGAPAPRVPPEAVATPPPPSPAAHDAADAGTQGFLGLRDDAVLAQLCNASIARIERNRGGSTLSFRVRFENGQKALFKPQQRAEVANFRAELAAYRMSRLLGLHRVPPACGRSVPRALLQRAADASGDADFSRRTMTELLGRGDNVPGAMLFWVPGQLEPVPGADTYATLLDPAQPLQTEQRTLAADVSTLVLFDFLNDNVDRWSGGNILRQRPDANAAPGPMLYMDNGASFSAIHDGLGARPDEQGRRLAAVGRVSRSFVARVRGLTAESIHDATAEDPLGPSLSDAQVHAVLLRRDRIIAHIDGRVATTPEAEVYAFP